MSDRIQSVAEKLGVDRDALKARFRVEREKRLRTDYVDQYRRAVEGFDHLLADPFVDGEVEREPLTDEVDVVIIGAGFGGMLCAARLRQQGVRSIRIIFRETFLLGTSSSTMEATQRQFSSMPVVRS